MYISYILSANYIYFANKLFVFAFIFIFFKNKCDELKNLLDEKGLQYNYLDS
jgi:hypothetical protein